MKVAVVSEDSDIGAKLVAQHRAAGDEVWSTSRNKLPGTEFLELSDRSTWVQPPEFDRLYYTIGISDSQGKTKEDVWNVNAMWTVDYLGIIARKNPKRGKIVVFGSQYGSTSLAVNARAYVYRMSKAALNMGVRCLQHAVPGQQWCVYHPGIVRTKMVGDAWRTFNFETLSSDEAARICINRINAWNGQFDFLSYTGERLSW